jgi:hypothetical protein
LRSLPNFFVTETKECGYSYFWIEWKVAIPSMSNSAKLQLV